MRIGATIAASLLAGSPVWADDSKGDAACKAYHEYSETSMRYAYEYLDTATDAGNGMIFQEFGSGDELMGKTMLMITDCTKNETLALGYGYWLFEPAGPDELAEFMPKVERRLREGGENRLSDLQALAVADGLSEAKVVSTSKRVRLSIGDEEPKNSYDLKCGCRLFYPGSPGAGN